MEKEELNRIVGQYGDYVFRMCYLYLKDRYLAEDVTQETFLSVYMKYDSLRDKTQEKNWIIQIAVNKCRSMLRKKQFRMEHVGLVLLSEDARKTDFDGQKESLSEAVMNLSIKEREVIIAYYYQEMSVKEVAKLFRISEAAVLQRLKRGREHLKQQLGTEMEDL